MHCGDALTVLQSLPAGSVQTCITSPPSVIERLGAQVQAFPVCYVRRLVQEVLPL